jgi:hypothetical protein
MKRLPSRDKSQAPHKPNRSGGASRNSRTDPGQDQGIRKDQRGQEQPADKKRARENR